MARTLQTGIATGVLCMAALSAVVAGQTAGHNQVEGPQWTRIDALVRDAMAAKQTPGAVVVVGQGERILYKKRLASAPWCPRKSR